MKRQNGLCAIEIVAVAAIILILAAIGTSVRQDFEIRKSIIRVRADMSSVATAIEAYAVDNGAYPFDLDSRGWPWYITDVFTTPVAYISESFIQDPFKTAYEYYSPVSRRYRFVNYPANAPPNPWPPSPYPGPFFSRGVGPIPTATIDSGLAMFGQWKLSSSGPDKLSNSTSSFFANDLIYDPTNGSISGGDIILSQRKRR